MENIATEHKKGNQAHLKSGPWPEAGKYAPEFAEIGKAPHQTGKRTADL